MASPNLLTVQHATFSQFLTTIFSAIGSVLAVILCAAFMIHILYHHKHQNGDPTHKRISSSSSIVANSMVIIYLSSAIITAIIYGFVRSNVFTFVPLSAFSHYQCAFGYSAGFLMASFNRMSLYFLFLCRIKSVFEGSAYEISAKTFKILRIVLIVSYSLVMVLAIAMFSQSKGFTLFYDDFTGFIWCGHQRYDGSLRWVLITWYICVVLGEIAINLTFLFMFSRGLYSLQDGIVMRHQSLRAVAGIPIDIGIMELVLAPPGDETPSTIHDHDAEVDGAKKEADDGKRSPTPLSMRSMSISSTRHIVHSGSLPHAGSFHEVMSKYCDQKGKQKDSSVDIDMLIKLHQLTKKTAILMCISTGSSLVYWIMSAVDGWYAILISWDVLVNAICAWLMLKSSIKYWNCCIIYGVCRCCYKELDHDML